MASGRTSGRDAVLQRTVVISRRVSCSDRGPAMATSPSANTDVVSRCLHGFRFVTRRDYPRHYSGYRHYAGDGISKERVPICVMNFPAGTRRPASLSFVIGADVLCRSNKSARPPNIRRTSRTLPRSFLCSVDPRIVSRSSLTRLGVNYRSYRNFHPRNNTEDNDYVVAAFETSS